MTKIFFSVGEPSGDLHAANLIRSLRTLSNESDGDNIDAIGLGGPRMQAAGCNLLADMTELAVMWLKQAFANLKRFRQLLKMADECMRVERPDAVVMIDFPGFNWWIARAAKRHGIPVFYYGVPQMWAWAGWRVGKMRRLVDHVLCKLPFEADWFRARRCAATYVGHPYFDELAERKLDAAFLSSLKNDSRPLVTLLPGSRMQEVRHNFPWLVKAAGRVLQKRSDTRFAVAAFNEQQADCARQIIADARLPISVHAGRTPELIDAAKCCLACSGSVSLELLYHEKPSAILYWVPRLQYWLVRYVLIRVRYITLVNLLAADDPFRGPIQPFDPAAPGAQRVPFPEYPTHEDKSEELAQHVTEWLGDDRRYDAKVGQLRDLKDRFAQPGASMQAARYILQALSQTQAPTRRAA